MNPVLKGYFFEKRLRLLLRLVLMMCYYINNNVENRFLITECWSLIYLNVICIVLIDFLYNFMMNLLHYWQNILEEWLENYTWCIVCMCVCCSSYRLIFRKAIMLNLFKVVSPLGPHESDAFALHPTLNVVTVVYTAFAMPVSFSRPPGFAVEARCLESLPVFR